MIKNIVAGLLAFSWCAGAVASAAEPWRPEGPISSARYALAAATAQDGTIYITGGAAGGGLTRTVQLYRPKLDKWVAGPALPGVRYRHAAATGGDGRIYVMGGIGQGNVLASVLALQPGPGATWVTAPPLPTARQLLDATSGIDGRIYAVGGFNINISEDPLGVTEVFSPATQQWTSGASMPTPRYSMGVARGNDGRIFTIGGCLGGVYSMTDVVEAYSPATDSWTTMAPLPSKRCALDATMSADGLIYAVGGCELNAGGTCDFTRRVDVYSPSLNKWWTVAPTKVVHDEGAVAAGRNRIYAIGGHTMSVESRPSACYSCR